MAEVAATVANGGKLMRPTFVQQVTDPDGRVTRSWTPTSRSTAVSAQTASELTEMMTNVTQEGTAAGLTVGGQSPSRARRNGRDRRSGGRASTSRGSSPSRRPTNPQVAVAATIERCQGASAREVAGPIATQVMESLL